MISRNLEEFTNSSQISPFLHVGLVYSECANTDCHVELASVHDKKRWEQQVCAFPFKL